MEGEVGPEAVKPIDSEKWHLAHAFQPLTLFGELIHYGDIPSRDVALSDPATDGELACRRDSAGTKAIERTCSKPPVVWCDLTTSRGHSADTSGPDIGGLTWPSRFP
jgi:hypothetical protein